MNKIVIIGFVVIVLSFTTGLASNGFNFAEAAGGWKPAVDALLAQITGLGDRTSDLEDEVFCSGNGTYDSETCTCDSGFSGNDCSETVPTPSQCGNGVIDSGESCDDGVDNGSYGFCNATCDDVLECGDDIINGPESCDDGNTANGDGCSSTCQQEFFNNICGNGVGEPGEQCDDGNTANGDGCSSTCLVEGNGDPIIQCSNGLDDDGDGLVDFPDDPNCTSLDDPFEQTLQQCSNGIDDDGDGQIDFPDDTGCIDQFDLSE